jgi:hypothetical protein
VSDVSVKYVVFRRLPDFDEYLQEDGDFGPLVVHQDRGRRDVTRVFVTSEHAEHFVRSWERKHPTVAVVVPLEVRRLP